MPEYRLIEKIVPTDREAVGNHPTHRLCSNSKLNAVIKMPKHVYVHFQLQLQTGGLQLQTMLGCNCRCSAAIADTRLQLQSNCRCSAAIAELLNCNFRLQIHSAGSPPMRGLEQKQLNCNCRLQIHSAGSPHEGGVRAKIARLQLQIENTLCRPPTRGRGSSQDSSVAIADCKYTLQAPHTRERRGSSQDIARLQLQIANTLCRPPTRGRGSSQDSSVAVADSKYTLQALHTSWMQQVS